MIRTVHTEAAAAHVDLLSPAPILTEITESQPTSSKLASKSSLFSSPSSSRSKNMLGFCYRSPSYLEFISIGGEDKIRTRNVVPSTRVNCKFSNSSIRGRIPTTVITETADKKAITKSGKTEHHLWQRKDSAGSGQKALNLVQIVSGLPNEKEAVYSALDKWVAWEVEFPVIAAAKALRIFKKRSQWKRAIQVAKWMLSKGQGTTMGTYETLLLAFDMDGRVDEAESLWNMILHTHTRSISKRLCSRMISLYDHHQIPDKIIEVFADMEELGVKPDEVTMRKVANAFSDLGQVENKKLLLDKYQKKWKYIYHKGERVQVRTDR